MFPVRKVRNEMSSKPSRAGQGSGTGVAWLIAFIGAAVVAGNLSKCSSGSNRTPAQVADSDPAIRTLRSAVAAQSPPPVQPLSGAGVKVGSSDMGQAVAAEGLSGAMIYSQNCFDDLSRSFSWRHLDTCGAADLMAVRSVPEGDAAGLEKEIAYFQSEVAAARYLGAATGAGEPAESADGRLAKMQERLPAPRRSATAAVTDEAAPATGDEGLVGNADASVRPVDLGY